MTETNNSGYDDLLAAIEEGTGYYVECENGHAAFPPRRICQECGSRQLAERLLPETGTVITYTIVSVATPRFQDDTPYVLSIVDFGPIRLTGQLRGITPDEVDTGLEVSSFIEEPEATDDPLVVFRPP